MPALSSLSSLSYLSIAYIVAALFAIIELGLTASIANSLKPYSSPRVSFMVFNSIWSLLVLAYVALAPLYLANLHHKQAASALNAVTAVFWFAGAIALAVISGLGVSAAASAFGFFLWVIFTGLTALDVLEWRRGGGGNPAAKTGPAAQPGV